MIFRDDDGFWLREVIFKDTQLFDI